jgi:hypothetical protein
MVEPEAAMIITMELATLNKLSSSMDNHSKA